MSIEWSRLRFWWTRHGSVWITGRRNSNVKSWYRCWERLMESTRSDSWSSPWALASSLGAWRNRVNHCGISLTVWTRPSWGLLPLSCGEWFRAGKCSALSTLCTWFSQTVVFIISENHDLPDCFGNFNFKQTYWNISNYNIIKLEERVQNWPLYNK